MSSRKFSLEAYFLIKARSETPTYRFNSVGHCSKVDRGAANHRAGLKDPLILYFAMLRKLFGMVQART
jgi:hypothetical protein